MPDNVPPLRPADRPSLLQSLSCALRFNRRLGKQDRNDLIAWLAAEQVLEHLERSNDVVMQGPIARAPSVGFPANPHLKD